MKKTLLTALLLGSVALQAEGSVEVEPSTQNRSIQSDSFNASLKILKSKSLLQKSVLAAKGISAGLASYVFLSVCVLGGKDSVKNFLNPKLTTFARLGGMCVFLFSLAMTAEMTNYSLRSIQDLM